LNLPNKNVCGRCIGLSALWKNSFPYLFFCQLGYEEKPKQNKKIKKSGKKTIGHFLYAIELKSVALVIQVQCKAGF
jgi:hypothetical protein